VFVLSAAQQRIAGYDAYDALGAALAALAALVLAVRLAGSAGHRRIRRSGIDEVLILLAAAGLLMLILHQGITDGLCHGSCASPPQSPTGRPR